MKTDLTKNAQEVRRSVYYYLRMFQNSQVGDEVITSYKINRGGGLAEFVSISAKYVIKKPGKVSFEEALALGIAALTAYQLVNKESYKVQEGETVFVQGGSGGVGAFTVQFAK